MSRVELRDATAADFAQLVETPLPYRVRAFAGVQGDTLLGIGGLAFQPGETVAAFLILACDEARKHKVALHKAGLRTMAEAKRLGIKRVVAVAQQGNPFAEPWLKRLGFEQIMVDGETAWVWQDKGG